MCDLSISKYLLFYIKHQHLHESFKNETFVFQHYHENCQKQAV